MKSRAFVVAALFVAAFSSAWLAWGDGLYRAGNFTRAADVLPRKPDYLLARATELEYSGGDAGPLLERAAVLAPFASAPRIRLGLRAEVRGDRAEAERWLLAAARVDHQFEPRWTLANFYFRANHAVEFWKWARSALEISYGDRKPAFDLCGRMGSPEEILSRAIPDRAEVVASFLIYLINEKQIRTVPAAAMKLAALDASSYRALLLGASGALIDAGDFASGSRLWTTLGEARPQGVTHPDFEEPRTGQGFDWRWTRPPGVTYVPLAAEKGLKIRLDGRQPESAALLRQPLANLQPGIRYSLRWQSRSQGRVSGLRWNIAGETAEVRGGEPWTSGEVSFRAPAGPLWLELIYKRPVGEPRWQGSVDLRDVHITP